jgi:hypothetical protein
MSFVCGAPLMLLAGRHPWRLSAGAQGNCYSGIVHNPGQAPPPCDAQASPPLLRIEAAGEQQGQRMQGSTCARSCTLHARLSRVMPQPQPHDKHGLPCLEQDQGSSRAMSDAVGTQIPYTSLSQVSYQTLYRGILGGLCTNMFWSCTDHTCTGQDVLANTGHTCMQPLVRTLDEVCTAPAAPYVLHLLLPMPLHAVRALQAMPGQATGAALRSRLHALGPAAVAAQASTAPGRRRHRDRLRHSAQVARHYE